MPTLPNQPVQGVNQGLFPFHVNKAFLKQTILQWPFRTLFGNEPTRPIVRHQMRAGEGWEYRVAKLNALDWTKPARDFNQVSGNAQQLTFDMDAVNCEGVSFPVVLTGRQLLELGTPIDLPSSIRPQLLEAATLNLSETLLATATWDRTGQNLPSNYRPATEKPSYDRIVLSGKPAGGTATENAADRIAYNAMAGLTTVLNGLAAGTAYNQNGGSAAHLQALKRLATKGGKIGSGAVLKNGVIEDAIRPALMKSRDGWPMNDYIYLTTSPVIEELFKDPAFSSTTAARGTVISSDQPEAISGADYIGKFFGIHIYDCKQLSDFYLTSQDGDKTVAWSMLIGAAAWSIGWFEETTIAYKDDTINRVQEFTTHEVRGQKALKFAAKQASTIAAGIPKVEQGIIHSFVRIG